MNTAKLRRWLIAGAMTLLATIFLQAPAAGQTQDFTVEESPTAARCGTVALSGVLGGDPYQEPVEQQTCGPCILDTCAAYYVRCTFVGCGPGNCCEYSCGCDPTCASGNPPGGACRIFLPSCCGNGIQEPGEQCDDPDLDGQTCISRGFDGGELACNGNCTFDTSECYECGDGNCDPEEDCESCSSDCEGRQTGKPSERYCCGNEMLEDAEGDGSICDGNP